MSLQFRDWGSVSRRKAVSFTRLFSILFFVFFMCRLFLSTRQLILVVCLLAIFSQSNAELLKDYKWTNRVIVTFSSVESNPDRLQLIQQIKQYSCQYRKRDLVHLDLIEGTKQYKYLSRKFSVSGNADFKLLLIGKDSEVKLTTTSSNLPDLFSLIDTMPLRKREIHTEKC
jgi:hypothetical protein